MGDGHIIVSVKTALFLSLTIIQYFGQFLDSDNLSRYNMLILLDITSWLSTD
jgi:hypothetical protein